MVVLHLLTAVAVFAALGLSACGAVDHFGPRSASYNVETADAKSRSILANVLRAADGRPLQFTDVTTVSGTGMIEGSLEAGLPIAVKPSTVERTFTLTPTVTANAGSTFNVANLNTQEFYYGLQTQVKVEQIANFIAAGYDPQLVLFLTIDQIDVKSLRREMVFQAATTSETDYRLFYQALRFLLEAGLSIRAGDDKLVGPELTADQIRDPRVLATLLGPGGGKLSISESPKGSGKYRLVRDGSYQFCFDPLHLRPSAFQPDILRTVGALKNLHILDAAKRPSQLTVSLVQRDNGHAEEASTFTVSPADYCDPPAGATKSSADDDFKMRPRSVEGIFQFLGAIARIQLASHDETAPMSIGVDRATSIYPFRVVRGRPKNAALTVAQNGQVYSIVADPAGSGDQSTRVVQLLTDLLALQSSAKDLPAPNVISVINR